MRELLLTIIHFIILRPAQKSKQKNFKIKTLPPLKKLK